MINTARSIGCRDHEREHPSLARPRTTQEPRPGPALDAYRKWVSPRLTSQRAHVQFAAWARTGRRIRDEFGTAPVSFEPDGIWVTDADGLQWRYEPDSWMSALGKELGWEHEQAELQSTISAIRPGGTYVDIGAHVGGFAIPVAQAHPDIQMHLFEPVPQTRSWLEANLERNGGRRPSDHLAERGRGRIASRPHDRSRRSLPITWPKRARPDPARLMSRSRHSTTVARQGQEGGCHQVRHRGRGVPRHARRGEDPAS